MGKSLLNKLKMAAVGAGLTGAVVSSGCMGPVMMATGVGRGNPALYALGQGVTSIEAGEAARSQTNVYVQNSQTQPSNSADSLKKSGNCFACNSILRDAQSGSIVDYVGRKNSDNAEFGVNEDIILVGNIANGGDNSARLILYNSNGQRVSQKEERIKSDWQKVGGVWRKTGSGYTGYLQVGKNSLKPGKYTFAVSANDEVLARTAITLK